MNATILIANPSADVYGSDLQLLQSVRAMRADDWDVTVAVPSDGPLVSRLGALGADVVRCDFPVLRRSSANLRGAVGLARSTASTIRTLRGLIRDQRPAVVYVNTLTLPWWLLAARTCRTPVICHVHEAERTDPRIVRMALAAPLRLASTCIVNSRATMAEVVSAQPRVANRLRLIHNGVPGPPDPPVRPDWSRRVRLVVVGRLSERKGAHVAIDAVSTLLHRGYDVELELCGSALESHGTYAAGLRARCDEPDLLGRVRFTGYASPIWPALERSNILVAPSFGESFGNAVVEAQLAARPVVATAVQGHLETVTNNETGLLVPLADASAIATAVARLIDDRDLATTLSAQARRVAAERFAPEQYGRAITSVIRTLATSHPAKTATQPIGQT